MKILIQVSNAEIGSQAVNALVANGVNRSSINISDSGRPIGEARELYDNGAQYLSSTNMNLKTFHMVEDTGIDINLQLLQQMARTFTQLVVQAADREKSLIE